MTREKPDEHSCSWFFRKYFWEGQHLDESSPQQELPKNADFVDVLLVKYRKYVAVLIPFLVAQFRFIRILVADSFALFVVITLPNPLAAAGHHASRIDHSRHCATSSNELLLTSGMTSEGGGAVAFPVMTLGLHIAPRVARDFSLVIQSIGMTCAMFVIVFMNVQIEKRAVLCGMVGSVPGFIFGSIVVDPLLTPPQKKMLFVSIWSSFAIALYMLNADKHRKTYSVIPDFRLWKAIDFNFKVETGVTAAILFTRVFSRIFTAFTGSGVDICIFSITTLLFRVTEKTATPTTIVLMGLNSVIGVYYRAVWEDQISPDALDYIKITIPVAVTLAPLGSFLGSHFHRKVCAYQ
ncbi:unnamed protein product [Nippostrongylus brasiliensis]|uniref:Membrane transporter protein n=1 Tax=Nippostrongylus brasiliensis TaxID=27835 RepID=A0A0N4Y3D3_NIPBR|nr:unnamed protein product [Nippostrongylus brasiliensis]